MFKSKIEHLPATTKACAALNNWVINAAAYNLLVNLSGLVGYTGGHVLGNFSVTKQKGEQGTGVSAKIKYLQQGMKDYKVVLESGGKVIPGGYTPYAMAAKQVWDNEVAPGRTWAVNGMGANVKTIEKDLVFLAAGSGRVRTSLPGSEDAGAAPAVVGAALYESGLWSCWADLQASRSPGQLVMCGAGQCYWSLPGKEGCC
jgi:hypothetical protein